MSATSLTPEEPLTPEEKALVGRIPLSELAALAAELDIVLPEVVEPEDLVVRCIQALADIAAAEGLPFSRFDREDLERLPPEELTALALHCGAPATVEGLLKAGGRVYKRYRRKRPGSQVALLLPTLLAPLARHIAGRPSQ